MSAVQNPVRGVLFAVLAVTIFAIQDGLSKHLGQHYPPTFVVMIRYWAFGAFVVLMSMRAKGGLRAVARTRRPVLQMVRGGLLALQIIVVITSFALAGIAATHSLFASAPLMVAALSAPVLGEQVGWRRWAAITVGFLGVLVILRPGADVIDPNAWLALVGAFGIAIYNVLTRLASREDSAETSFFYTGVGGAVVMTFVGPFFWTNMTPPDWGLMAALCLTGAAGHYFLIRALELADAVLVQPAIYLQLVMASLIGVFVFHESVDAWTVVGAAIIVAAGGFTFWRERARARRAALEPAAAPSPA